MCKMKDIVKWLLSKNITVSVAESLTGGLLASAFIDYPGISAVFLEGVVAYANEAKVRLGVKAETIEKYGAVSHETAREMAVAIRRRSHADIGISTTGIAGPDGGTPKKPVGLVYVGIATEYAVKSYVLRLCGDRQTIREKTLKVIEKLLIDEMERYK